MLPFKKVLCPTDFSDRSRARSGRRRDGPRVLRGAASRARRARVSTDSAVTRTSAFACRNTKRRCAATRARSWTRSSCACTTRACGPSTPSERAIPAGKSPGSTRVGRRRDCDLDPRRDGLAARTVRLGCRAGRPARPLPGAHRDEQRMPPTCRSAVRPAPRLRSHRGLLLAVERGRPFGKVSFKVRLGAPTSCGRTAIGRGHSTTGPLGTSPRSCAARAGGPRTWWRPR